MLNYFLKWINKASLFFYKIFSAYLMAVYKIGLMTYDGKTVKTSNYQSLNGITNVI